MRHKHCLRNLAYIERVYHGIKEFILSSRKLCDFIASLPLQFLFLLINFVNFVNIVKQKNESDREEEKTDSLFEID